MSRGDVVKFRKKEEEKKKRNVDIRDFSRERNWNAGEDKERKVGYVTASRCYKRTVLTDCTSTFSKCSPRTALPSRSLAKSSRIPRVRFIRFNEDICVPLRCPLPASIAEQKRQALDAYTIEPWSVHIKKRISISSLAPLSLTLSLSIRPTCVCVCVRESTDDPVRFALSSSCCQGYRCFRANIYTYSICTLHMRSVCTILTRSFVALLCFKTFHDYLL